MFIHAVRKKMTFCRCVCVCSIYTYTHYTPITSSHLHSISFLHISLFNVYIPCYHIVRMCIFERVTHKKMTFCRWVCVCSIYTHMYTTHLLCYLTCKISSFFTLVCLMYTFIASSTSAASTSYIYCRGYTT